MRQLTVLLVIAGLLLGSSAMAQWGYGMRYADEAYQGFRLNLGWAKPGTLDGALVYGGGYIWKDGLGTVNYLRSEGVDLWTLEYSYLLRGQDDPSLYYGAGVGWANASWDEGVNASQTLRSTSDSSIIWNLVVGKEFGAENQFGKNSWFVEGRYCFGSSIGGSDVDGLRIVGGYRF